MAGALKVPSESQLELSRKVFGSAYRLPILASIAEASLEDCYPAAVAARSGVAHNQVSTFMKSLESVGLLAKAPNPTGRRQRHYVPVESVLWELALKLYLEETAGRSLF